MGGDYMKMNILFYIAFAFLTLYTFVTTFIDVSKSNLFVKFLIWVVAIVAVWISIKYQVIEKQQEEYSSYVDQLDRQEIKEKIDASKDKEKKGLMNESDYLKRISYEIEDLNLNFMRSKGKYAKDFLTGYFSQVAQIPTFFNIGEWKESEALIYKSVIDEINAVFNMRGMFNSGGRTELIDLLDKERQKLVIAREREFNK